MSQNDEPLTKAKVEEIVDEKLSEFFGAIIYEGLRRLMAPSLADPVRRAKLREQLEEGRRLRLQEEQAHLLRQRSPSPDDPDTPTSA